MGEPERLRVLLSYLSPVELRSPFPVAGPPPPPVEVFIPVRFVDAEER